ncbi:hypothetical protein IV203_007341 [Nitzschia inconspicua]|uniref:Uncharacterized protein n=1 Tax=Nitzschia inconspicua TaxID=303405 RepID=A0A9K3KF98_9STRA|nr:hypothetical protein IV203_007341 [Nitzschia inconspicua]
MVWAGATMLRMEWVFQVAMLHDYGLSKRSNISCPQTKQIEKKEDLCDNGDCKGISRRNSASTPNQRKVLHPPTRQSQNRFWSVPKERKTAVKKAKTAVYAVSSDSVEFQGRSMSAGKQPPLRSVL